jgi:hypothetical protein
MTAPTPPPQPVSIDVPTTKVDATLVLVQIIENMATNAQSAARSSRPAGTTSVTPWRACRPGAGRVSIGGLAKLEQRVPG